MCLREGWRCSRVAALGMIAASGAMTPAVGARLTLVAHKQTPYTIVVDAAAPPAERFAAEELQTTIETIAGVKIPIASNSTAAKLIVIGGHRAGEALTVPSRYREDDAFRIKTDGERLILKGATARGTLYAVYALLGQLGCRWFGPAIPALDGRHEIVPRSERVAIEELDLTEQPLMQFRKRDGDLGRRSHTPESWPALFAWMGRARTNSFAISIEAYEKNRTLFRDESARRGMMLHVGQHAVMERFLSRAKYFQSHPEWFGMIGSERTARASGRPVMFETANSEAVRTFHRNMVDYLRARPEIDVLQLWPPDGALWSESPESALLGAPPERMAQLVQQTARVLRAAGLKTRVGFIAYSSFADPPRKQDFDPATILEFCPINQNHRHRLSDEGPAANVTYHGQLRQWLARFPGPITHYSYYAKYSWRSLPVVLPEQIADEIQHWHSMGEVGTSLYCEPGNWLTLEANHLAFARASWDARFEAARWFDDYLRDRFGAAAEPMKQFYTAATAISLDALIPQSRTMRPEAAAPILAEVRRALAEAQRTAASGDARWFLGKIAWQADYLERALALRGAELARNMAQAESIRAEIATLIARHANDGTALDRGFGYRTAE